MKAAVKRHNLVFFYLLVLLMSGLLLIGQTYVSAADNYSISLPQLAPALAVVLISLFTGDHTPLVQIRKSIPLARRYILWVPAILGLTTAVILLTAGILSLLGIPTQRWNGTALNVLVMALGCFFEEVGWRGYMLPQLERRHNPLVSSFIVGFLWGLWHMSFNLGFMGFMVFIITAIEMSVLMTWIYHKTNGNLLLMALWHCSVNTLNQIALTGRLTATGFSVLAIVLGVFCVIVVIKNQKLYAFMGKKQQ